MVKDAVVGFKGVCGLDCSRHRQRLPPVRRSPHHLNPVVRGEYNLCHGSRVIVVVNDEHTARRASQSQRKKP